MQKRIYQLKTRILASMTILAIAVLANSHVYAANAVGFKSWTGGISDLNVGGTISANETGLKSAYTGNILLDNSAWAHTGDWYTFHNLGLADVTVTVTGGTGFVPGLTVWATGGAKFDGGTTDFGSEISLAGFGAPHSFNATGAMGATGTLWMANGQGGNVVETLGYAVAGPANFTGGWGESIMTGAHDVSLTNTFENGVSGSVGANIVSLLFNDLNPGWYALYIGGTDHLTAGGTFELTVSAVPEADTWAMLLAGLGFLGWHIRRSRVTA